MFKIISHQRIKNRISHLHIYIRKDERKKNLIIPTTDENEVQHKLSYFIGWNANVVALHVKKKKKKGNHPNVPQTENG